MHDQNKYVQFKESCIAYVNVGKGLPKAQKYSSLGTKYFGFLMQPIQVRFSYVAICSNDLDTSIDIVYRTVPSDVEDEFEEDNW